MPFGRPFRAISLCVSFPGLKPWAVLFSPFGRPKMSKPAGSMVRSCLGKARRLTFPGLKPWAVFRSSFGRLEYAQENVQTAV